MSTSVNKISQLGYLLRLVTRMQHKHHKDEKSSYPPVSYEYAWSTKEYEIGAYGILSSTLIV